nr:PIN domain-containing protein [uncultured Dethiosulfovibrio sp.]
MTDGLIKIMRFICRVLLALLGGIAGYQLALSMVPHLSEWIGTERLLSKFILSGIFVFLCGSMGFLIAPVFLRILGLIGTLFEKHLQSTRWQDISAATTGLFIGLILANLVAMPFSGLPVGPYIAVFLNLVIGYVLARLFVQRQHDIRGALSLVIGLRQRLNLKKDRTSSGSDDGMEESPMEFASGKILDTSVIIDGRILDIAKTGFLEGSIILPRFVLAELQAVADSRDPNKRTRGRRGLDVVKSLQKIPHLEISIMEIGLKELDVDLVDNGLIALAKKIDGKILTTDYNLNKVAQIRDIVVLNVNDLSNSLKPSLLPGEVAVVDVIREGKEHHQGVGYLENGTMLVVEDGADYIGHRVEVVVTSMLQTSAGRMVFGKVRKEVDE